MSVLATRRAALDNGLKEKIKQRVKQLLQEKTQNGDGDASGAESGEEDSSEGMVYLFDEDGSSREARIAHRLFALEFDTRKEFEQYKKEHDVAPGTKVDIKEEQKKGPAKEDKSKERAPGKEEKPTGKAPGKEEKPKEQEKAPEKQDKPSDKPEAKEPDHQHPTRVKDGPQRQLAIKDKLIDEFGTDAKSWNVHKVDKTQLTGGVLIKFPDGSSKKYKDLNDAEKERVHKAIEGGLTAHKGLNDYSSVDVSTLKKNMANNLSSHDDESVEETKVTDKEPASKENAAKFVSSVRENGRNLVRKYSAALSKISRPMVEKYVDDMSETISEAISDGSMGGASQADIDEFMREDVKRLVHQEIETRRRSLGDHGVRHVAGNAKSSMSMLNELQQHGIKVTGKQKLMAMAIQANHDMGYTVGAVATDISKGGEHKNQSKVLADEEKGRYDKIFGAEDSDKMRTIIHTHDSADIDWEKDPVGSSVRLADNTSLFGNEKVQDLFIRNPKTMGLACKLRLAAQMEPTKPSEPKREKFKTDEDFSKAQKSYEEQKKSYESPESQEQVKKSRDLQKNVKEQMHDAIEEGGFDDLDVDELHRQVDEMSEGKFSTTADILSRYSGKIKGFKFDPSKKMMNVDMAYSPEGEMVDSLFGDEVSAKQFDKFAKDMKVQPMKGKRGKMTFKNPAGERVFSLNIEGVDKEPIASAATGSMRDFLSKTARGDLRHASSFLKKEGAGEKEVEKAKKVFEKSKEKFSDKEWEELMKALDEGKDLGALAKKLDSWPLFAAELEYLGAKTASLNRVAMRVAMGVLGDKVAMSIVAARGLQVNRKDKDTMSDTGGSSKKPDKEPSIKPPREDVSKPWRTKDKTKEEKDPDVDRDKDRARDRTRDPDTHVASSQVSIAKQELARWPRKFADAVERA